MEKHGSKNTRNEYTHVGRKKGRYKNKETLNRNIIQNTKNIIMREKENFENKEQKEKENEKARIKMANDK